MRLIIDFVDLVFYLIHIESLVHLICDYGLTGDSDCMERMSLNFVWIPRLAWNCCKNDVACSGNPLRSTKSCMGRGSYNY